LFLSVTNGVRNQSKLMSSIQRRWQDAVVLIGASLSIPYILAGSAWTNEVDMCGAASAWQMDSRITVPINVNAVVPACENLPGNTATRPGDIIRSMSGQTIEILNTDAEGRLILCDALTYSRRFKPHTIIDVATLTGACVIALGHYRTAVMSPSDSLVEKITAAGIAADDRCWHMPIARIRTCCAHFHDLATSARAKAVRSAPPVSSASYRGLDDPPRHRPARPAARAAQGATGRRCRYSEFLLRHAGAVP
jgi:hypothetical protein